ncbi:MAG: DEAD/DEAH box helicase family protein [Saprospiraceae bacterium]
MLKNIQYPESREYRTGAKYEPYQFYLESLIHSNSANLLLGYFSSSAIKVLSLGFAYFLYNGGVLKLVINQFISDNDFNILKESKSNYLNDYSEYIEDFDLLKITLDEYGRHFFKCLAWLIANDRIQIVIVKPKKGRGIAHFKSGVLSDGENQVKFKASCNFTASGLLANLEELTVKLSWDSNRDVKAIEEQNEYFDKIFNKEADFVEYLNHDKLVINEIERKYGNTSLEELLEESEVLREKEGLFISDNIQKYIKGIENQIKEDLEKPKFPYPAGPRDYQNEAYKNWIKNDKKGIFAMATGTGKTITSLNCLLNEYRDTGSYQAVIIVPTIALVNQWENECEKFNFNDIIKVNSKEKWSEKVSLVNTISHFKETSFIIIITYASFYRKKFQSYFKKLPNQTLIIADEVHNIGTNKLLKTLPNIHLQKRIGLSATPNRYYDDIGNKKIEEFFNSKYPYTFQFTMKQALEKGWLCNYTYYPHLVELDNEEFEEYIKISLQLMKFFDSKTLSYKKSEEVEKLLMIRKRIIHKAKNKLIAFNRILKDEFNKKRHLKYTLIYVPEGTNPDYAQTDEYQEDDDELKLITNYTRTVSRIDFDILVKQYTAKTKNRDELIKNFENGKVHVLTSMKCLDEGVDVPRSELAIFCASTGNPRQFIQRRGRVLRKHNDKTHAVIHDLVVIPQIGLNEKTYNMERSLVKKELDRVKDFAALASNKMDTYEVLKNVLDFYNLNLYNEN